MKPTHARRRVPSQDVPKSSHCWGPMAAASSAAVFALAFAAAISWPGAAWAVNSTVATLLPKLIDPQALLGIPIPGRELSEWIWMAVVPLLALPAWLLIRRRPRRVNIIEEPGFEVISPSERRQFVPIQEKYRQLDFISQIKTDGTLRLSANLNRVSLSIRRYGYLLEDKNFRNALLVNRRRMRRTLLRDGDVLDLGDLTLLYRDPRSTPAGRFAPPRPHNGKAVIKFRRVRGPVRRGTPYLVSEQFSNRIFYITKNVVYIGRSEINDLVVKAPAVQYRHAKIERVGARYKLLDLGLSGNTFVNNRRVEQRFLKEGDVISIDRERFKFQIVAKPVRDRPYGSGGAYGAPAEESGENEYGEEAGAV